MSVKKAAVYGQIPSASDVLKHSASCVSASPHRPPPKVIASQMSSTNQGSLESRDLQVLREGINQEVVPTSSAQDNEGNSTLMTADAHGGKEAKTPGSSRSIS